MHNINETEEDHYYYIPTSPGFEEQMTSLTCTRESSANIYEVVGH